MRGVICGDAIRLTDDLYGRVRDASAAAVVELRSEFESKLAAHLAQTEKRAERARERVPALEIAMVELRGAVRDDAIRPVDDLRGVRDAALATVAELRSEIEVKIAAVAERPGKLSIAKAYEPGAVVYWHDDAGPDRGRNSSCRGRRLCRLARTDDLQLSTNFLRRNALWPPRIGLYCKQSSLMGGRIEPRSSRVSSGSTVLPCSRAPVLPCSSIAAEPSHRLSTRTA